jgi:hypothetical protein
MDISVLCAKHTYMKIEQLSPSAIYEYGNNSRTHSEEQIDQIVKSINEFGFTNPILINKDGRIIAGHGRYQAAVKMKLAKVPCIRLTQLSERQERAYVIADNQIALNAGYDFAKLSAEIDALIGLDFDVDLLGFDEQAIDSLLKNDFSIFPDLEKVEVSSYTRQKHAEEKKDRDKKSKGVKQGDLYQLGRHRLFCGDSAHPGNVELLLDGASIKLMCANLAVGDDPVVGLGAVIIAAEQTDRTCYLMENSSGYCDIILERWVAFSGESAVFLGNYAENRG